MRPSPPRAPRRSPPPGPRILGPGDHGPKVRELQSRLRQIAWYFGNVTDDYGPSTTAAVKGFQKKREIAVTGYVDQRTLNRLAAMTRTPTARRARQPVPRRHLDQGALDPRCTTAGRCASTSPAARSAGSWTAGPAHDVGAVRVVVHPDA